MRPALRALALALALAVAGTAATVVAEARSIAPPSADASSENATLAFADAILPTYGVVCDRRFPGYLAKHAPTYARWRHENAERIKDGEQTIREWLPRTGETPENAREKAIALVRRIETAPLAIADRNCRYMAGLIGMEMP